MEEIYLRGFLGRREWCSDVVNLKSYFDQYTSSLIPVTGKKVSEIDILQMFVPQSNQLSQEELENLIEVTEPTQLTMFLDEDLPKKSLKERSSNSSSNELVNIVDEQDNPKIRSELKKPKNRIKDEKVLTSRREIPVNTAEKVGSKDLLPRQNFLVSFRIHEPFTHKVEVSTRPGRCSHQIWVLNYQTLHHLRRFIICESDYQDVRGDVSDRPDSGEEKRAKEEYPSSMFYFNNTFYIDTTSDSLHDYSKPIKEWAHKRGLCLGETLRMENTKVEDLDFRFGYPYLFMHQGCCEHLIVINDARLLTINDSLYSSDYPLMTKVTHNNLTKCMTCSRFPARWIVRDCERLAHDPSFLCKACFKSFHYVNGDKVGDFRAYHYLQRSTIL